jgi:hypothetical protein
MAATANKATNASVHAMRRRLAAPSNIFGRSRSASHGVDRSMRPRSSESAITGIGRVIGGSGGGVGLALGRGGGVGTARVATVGAIAVGFSVVALGAGGRASGIVGALTGWGVAALGLWVNGLRRRAAVMALGHLPRFGDVACAEAPPRGAAVPVTSQTAQQSVH